MKKIKLFLVSLFLGCWSASSAALPITVDFGFTDPPGDGISGNGFFTVGTVIGSTSGGFGVINDYIFTGTCLGDVPCDFGLDNVTEAFWDFTNPLDPRWFFQSSSLSCVESNIFGCVVELTAFVEADNAFGLSEQTCVNLITGQYECLLSKFDRIGDGWEWSVRDDTPPPVPAPAPATLALFGLGLTSLWATRRKRGAKV